MGVWGIWGEGSRKNVMADPLHPRQNVAVRAQYNAEKKVTARALDNPRKNVTASKALHNPRRTSRLVGPTITHEERHG